MDDGRVVDDNSTDESVQAIRSLNSHIAADRRVKVVLLPIGDGVSFVQKI